MSYLSKKNPTILFQIVFAIITLVLTTVLALFFAEEDIRKLWGRPQGKVLDKSLKEPALQNDVINPEDFGVVYIKVESPSYAQSNFDVNPKTGVTVYLNGKVDDMDLNSKVTIVDTATGDAVSTTYTLEDRAQDEDREDLTMLWEKIWEQKAIFYPKDELYTSSRYKVMVLPGIYNEDRSKVSKNKFEFEFLTADKPGVFSTNVDRSPLRASENLQITFRSPMLTDELDSTITINPDNIPFEIENYDKILTVKSDKFEAFSKYTLTIPGAVRDIYGRPLGEDYILEFEVN